MKLLAWITTTLCIIYGAIAFIIYHNIHNAAIEESKSLREIKAVIESVQRCPEKGLCYLTIVSYQMDGKYRTAKVIGNHGREGDIIMIWTKPGLSKGYESPSALVEQSTAFLPLLFLPTILIVLPLLLALQGKRKLGADANSRQRGQIGK
mgnify:CR=1 FL=1